MNSEPALLDHPLLSLAQIAALLPPQREGKPVRPQTIKGWIVRGVRLPDGTRVRLEAVRMGSRWLSDRARVAKFIEAQTRAAESVARPAPFQPAQHRRHTEPARLASESVLG